MLFHDLGPLWVESEGLPIPLHGRRMEVVLAALLVRRGEPARPDWLIDCVWGDDPPPTVAAALDTLLWRLRRTLDPDRATRAPSTVLRTDRQGYRLTVDASSVDSRQLAAAADAVLALGDEAGPEAVLDASSAALGLWHGRPYDSIDDSGWLEAARAEAADHRLTVQRARIGALLARGAPEQAASELVVALAENPFDERLWHHRMLGLYRSGRQTAALDAYREARNLLDTELGVEPGPELRALHEQILRQDPGLLLSTGMPRPQARASVRIPRRRSALIGRDDDIQHLDAALDGKAAVTVVGPVGCGKTALAVAVASRVAARFPDGVYFVDLSDVTDGSLVPERVLEVFALDPDSGAASAERAIIEYARGRHLLLVLDNCEQIVDPVATFAQALLEAAPGVRLLATSRQPLGLDGEQAYRLEPLELPRSNSATDLMSSPAVTLFLDRLGDAVDLAGADGREVARICAATDGLPLSIELAAARARFFQLFEVATSVADSPIALGPAGRGRAGPHEVATLRDAIAASHRLLSRDEQAAHRRLSLLPPGFTLAAAVGACDGAVHPERVIGVMTSLANHSLLQSAGSDRENGPTLFRQLVAIRTHATEQLDQSGDRAAGRDAVARWVVDLITGGVRLGEPGQAEWYQRLDDNRRTLVATLETEIAEGPPDQVLVAASLLDSYWIDRMHQDDGRRIAAAAIRRLGPHHGSLASAVTRAAYGTLVAVDQRTDEVRSLLAGAITDLAAVPPGDRLLAADRLVAMATWAWAGDDDAVAAAAAEAATRLAPHLHDSQLDLALPAIRGLLELWTDRDVAHASAVAVLAANEELDNAFWSLVACAVLSIEALVDEDGAAGLRWTDEILARYERLGTRSIADTLETRGNHYVNAGRLADAVRCYGAARFQNEQIGRRWPRHPPTAGKLAAAREALPVVEFESAWASGERLGSTNLVRGWL